MMMMMMNMIGPNEADNWTTPPGRDTLLTPPPLRFTKCSKRNSSFAPVLVLDAFLLLRFRWLVRFWRLFGWWPWNSAEENCYSVTGLDVIALNLTVQLVILFRNSEIFRWLAGFLASTSAEAFTFLDIIACFPNENSSSSALFPFNISFIEMIPSLIRSGAM